MSNNSKPPIVVATFPRSGTHLAIDSLRLNFRCCHAWKWPLSGLSSLYVSFDDLSTMPDRHAEARVKAHQKRCERPIVKTHKGAQNFLRLVNEQFAWAEPLRNSRIVHVTRNVRDVLASLYYFDQSGLSFVDWLQRPRGSSQSLPALSWQRHSEGWAKVAHVSVSYESLVKEPGPTLGQLGKCLGMIPEPGVLRLPPKSSRWKNAVFGRLGWRSASSAIVSPKNPGWHETASDFAESILAEQLGS